LPRTYLCARIRYFSPPKPKKYFSLNPVPPNLCQFVRTTFVRTNWALAPIVVCTNFCEIARNMRGVDRADSKPGLFRAGLNDPNLNAPHTGFEAGSKSLSVACFGFVFFGPERVASIEANTASIAKRCGPSVSM
jgi:hypothetical protein